MSAKGSLRQRARQPEFSINSQSKWGGIPMGCSVALKFYCLPCSLSSAIFSVMAFGARVTPTSI